MDPRRGRKEIAMTEVKTYYFTEGNVVRQAAEPQPLPNRRQTEHERREEQARRRRRQQRRHAAMMRRKRMYAVYFAGIVAATCGLFVGYINLTNSITTHMNNISELESQITELKAENSAAQSRIDTSTNLGAVKAAAMNDLGMVYAREDQIVYYSMENSDYMSQYHNIP